MYSCNFNFDKETVKAHEKINLVDSEANLELYYHDACSNEDSEIVKKARGLVYDGNELLFVPFGFTPIYTVFDSIVDNLNLSNYTILNSYEGTLLRVFYSHNKWYITTCKRLDAFKRRWRSFVPFGKLFCEALECEYATNELFRNRCSKENTLSVLDKFLSTLEKEKVYLFLLKSNEYNRLVCNVTTNKILHVGTQYIKENDNNKEFVLDLNLSVDLPRPEQVQFETIQELINYVELLPNTLQGVLLMNGDEQLKIFNSEYKIMYDLVGNTHSIKLRYLQLRNNKEQVDMFVNNFQVYKDTFDKLEKSIAAIIERLHQLYVKKYIQGYFIDQNDFVTRDEYLIVRKCHGWHCFDRDNNKVTLHKVREVVNSWNPYKLLKIIKNY